MRKIRGRSGRALRCGRPRAGYCADRSHLRAERRSCNGCESELGALLGPVYKLQRYGIDLVDSPHQADLLLVTGPVTRHLRAPLLRAYEAMPAPKLVLALGACACSGGVFHASYAVPGRLDDLLPVDLYLPGCPPPPEAILHGLLLALGRAEGRLVQGRLKPSGGDAEAT